jgi:5-methyltetrahydrofolate--homocysteine methyltransferase
VSILQTILERINSGEFLVADGAMGSLLFQKGLQPGECPESVNLTKPEILKEIAQQYFDAGAEIIQTNTFGGSPLKLSEYGLEEETEKINSVAIECVRSVVGDRAYVSGSCGPSGGILKPYGDTDPEVLYQGFERQVKALINAGVDIVCVETMTDLQEATLAVKAVKNNFSKTPVMATMTFDPTPRGFFTVMGNSIKDVAARLQSAGADIIGSNCGNGLENMIEIAKQFKEISDLPILIQSNAGIPEFLDGVLNYPETADFFMEKIPELIDSGVSIIGGCCGTTPSHTQAIKKALDSLKK